MSLTDMPLKELVFMIPHARRLGIRLRESQGENLLIEMPYNAELEVIAGSGIMANGAITALMDTALGAAVLDQFKVLLRIATLDLRVDYFAAPEPYSSLIVKTRCLKVTDKVVFVQGDGYCSNEATPIAHAVGVFSYVKVEASMDNLEKNGDVGQEL